MMVLPIRKTMQPKDVCVCCVRMRRQHSTSVENDAERATNEVFNGNA